MKIIVIHKAEFHRRPPIISVVKILLDLGYSVSLITTGITEQFRKDLSDKGVEVFVLHSNNVGDNILHKIFYYISFRNKAFSIINSIKKQDDNILLWVEGAYTIVSLGTKLHQYNYILQIQELHEKSKLQLNSISKVIHEAKAVFMPEYNRTILYQVWFQLKKRPIVLPNKPYFIPNKDELSSLEFKYKEYVNLFKQYKIILYQGLIHKERDLSGFVQAIDLLKENYRLVLMGHDYGMLSQYKKINPNIIHIDFIPAPYYLLLTSLAYIGIVCYDPRELNTAYCAPNKIYEYGAFKKPMIGNNIPGLQIIERKNAGVLVEEDDPCSICYAIKKIDSNYTFWSNHAYSMYEEVDNKQIIKDVLTKIVG